ncbi:MAG: PRC-barrel domain-containing protein [Nitrospiraceae bacterium]|nr:PRC-barrel domain-containing protein [Nitrospiraceae bacterium]
MMKKITLIFIGMGFLSLPFVTYSHAEMKSGTSPSSGETVSPEPRGATKAGETDITNTKGQGSLPSKYTIMPVATGKKVEVDSEMIGDTVKSPKGEDIGKLEQLIMDSETKRIEYAMISIGDTGQLKAYPWSSFKVNKEQGNVVLNVTKEQLQTKMTDLSPDIQALEQQLQTLRKNESRKGAREGQNFGDRDAAGPMGEEKRSGGAEAPPVSGK